MKKIFWPDYQLDGSPKYSLDRIIYFANKMNNIQDKIPNIFHIAGTNGKGSTTAYLKAILEENGYLVHRFTSPHLIEWNERIEVSSKIITDDYANELALECKNFAEKNNLTLSYFEGIMMIAFMAFSRNSAIATILEVGLGGRLDATNIINNPLSQIITSISMDHQKILGNTIQEIANEKAGIIKENKTLIINKQKEEVFDLLYQKGLEKHNKIYGYGKEWSVEKLKDTFIFKGFNKELELPLPYLQGDFQIYNAGGAIASLLSQNKIEITEKSIINGMKNVRWKGRLQDLSNNEKIKSILSKNSEVLIDGAHNEDGAKEITTYLKNKKDNKYNILVIGMLERKERKDYIAKLEKIFDLVITIKIKNEEKSVEPEIFKNEFLESNWKNVISSQYFEDALKYIGENFKEKDNIRVLVAGSLYLVGEVLEYL